MANININNLNCAGSDLLSDSESYLEALSDADLNLQGGIYTSALSTVTTIIYWTL
jgi:hypothetical protein